MIKVQNLDTVAAVYVPQETWMPRLINRTPLAALIFSKRCDNQVKEVRGADRPAAVLCEGQRLQGRCREASSSGRFGHADAASEASN